MPSKDKTFLSAFLDLDTHIHIQAHQNWVNDYLYNYKNLPRRLTNYLISNDSRV